MNVIVVQSLVMAVLAVMFAAVWLRSREPGTWLLAIGFAVAAGWYLFSDLAPNTGEGIDTLPERLSAITVGVAILLRTGGVVLYLGWPTGALRHVVVACSVPAVACLAWMAIGGGLTHRAFHVAGLLPYLGAAVLAFDRARSEPGNAHALLGLALLTLPLLPFVLGVAGVPADQLKYYTGVAVIVFGLLVLTVSLLRRHRALEAEVARRHAAELQLRDANQRLETRVGERTAHLHELIGGLESFARGVSHDLRGPLGGMSQLAQTAADAMARGDATLATRALPLIASQCDASVKMVNAMLELARVGETQAQRVPVNLGEVVASSFDEVRLAHPEARNASLRCGAMPAWLQADPVLLRTALVNLIGNAVKFSSGADEPRVEVDAAVEGGDVVVHVRDNGCGFPAELAPRLFEPFFRAPGTQQLGHGLGLSIARRAVEAMGGRIWATAQPGQGAQIGLRLTGALLQPAPEPALEPAP
ncbi:MAG: ATP-binding protein [Piscinibacter sp.]|uniref:sensor histidine kinase n=1 Tax=Piscinibacter sp. TaxID=1903157 RepID=UPI003D0FAFF3